MARPNIRYVTDTSKWPDWGLEYRYGGFYLFPPPPIIDQVDELRRTYDPRSHRGCRAHVSLSEPLPRPLKDSDIDELSAALAWVAPFVVTYGDVHATAPYPGVVFAIEPIDKFMALRSVTHSVSVFERSPLSRKDSPAHMTIAEFISLDQSIALERRLKGSVDDGEWLCTEIEYAVPDEDGTFRRVLTIQLGESLRSRRA